MIIKNKRELATTELRSKLLNVVEAGIASVLPPAVIQAAVKYDRNQNILTINNDSFNLNDKRVFIIGGGKASASMAQTLEKILSFGNISDGIVISKNRAHKTHKIKIIEAGHPIPDERGLHGMEQILNLKHRYSINEKDLIICLISGGGSALMPCPVEGVALNDKQEITQLLLDCGANIHEINAVRKHLSKTKGGGLARYFFPATIIGLILSDVIGDDLDVIASGHTCPDSSTFSTALKILIKYDLLSKAPRAVVDALNKGCLGEIEETPKTLTNCHNYLIGNSKLALEAMFYAAKRMGFVPFVITANQAGDTASAALLRAAEILNRKYCGFDMLLIGGETTPILPPNAGKGGRNQHYAAVSMLALTKYEGDWTLASVGTDGSDYLPDVAGAIVDNLSSIRAMKLDISSYLERYDSYNLLDKIGNSLIFTGNTGTNVGDIMVYAFSKVMR